jgi:hypothetical protein
VRGSVLEQKHGTAEDEDEDDDEDDVGAREYVTEFMAQST